MANRCSRSRSRACLRNRARRRYLPNRCRSATHSSRSASIPFRATLLATPEPTSTTMPEPTSTNTRMPAPPTEGPETQPPDMTAPDQTAPPPWASQPLFAGLFAAEQRSAQVPEGCPTPPPTETPVATNTPVPPTPTPRADPGRRHHQIRGPDHRDRRRNDQLHRRCDQHWPGRARRRRGGGRVAVRRAVRQRDQRRSL